MLAKTLLAVMIKCLFGGPTFLIRLIPVCGLDAEFQHDVAVDVLNSVDSAGGKVVAIICDDNRVNQRMFQKFETLPNKPWLRIDQTFLLFDYVHLLKNVRNNWITEKN